MPDLDTVIRAGTVVTATDAVRCDVGIRDGRIVALAEDLPAGRREIDATGRLVLPGGIDAHCHIEQRSSTGRMCADDWYTGSVSAAFGGTTTIVPFAAQHRGQSLRAVVQDYHARAEAGSVIDYSYHLIVSDPTEQVLGQDLPALIRDGITSFKVYTTYDQLKIDDRQFLDLLTVARHDGAMVMVHAENDDAIRWIAGRLLDRGHTAPKFHAVAHSRIAEAEATHRVIALAELVDQPILIVHVASAEATTEIARAQARGLKIYGETCPQYLFLTARDLDRDGLEGAKYCCSPPPRDAAAQEAIWLGLQTGTFQVFHSDHAPFRFDETGKLAAGPQATFKQIANGVPGLELRLPLLFSEGVRTGRIDIHRFVALTATNAAKLYGLHPRKGTIAVGSDADLAIWTPERRVTIGWANLHDNVGYTPYEGRAITGWPDLVMSRGRMVVEDGMLQVDKGSGMYHPRTATDWVRPRGIPVPEMDPARNFGARLAP